MRGVKESRKLNRGQVKHLVVEGLGEIGNPLPLVVEGVRFIGGFVSNRGVRPYKILEAMHKAAAAVSS